MSEINVTIAGRGFRMACEDGQESHLRGLAEQVDKAIVEMRANFGEIGDLRLTVMGAIQIADDLGEARRRIAELQGEIERHRHSGSAADEALASGIAAVADRIEQVSGMLTDRARRVSGAGGDGTDILD